MLSQVMCLAVAVLPHHAAQAVDRRAGFLGTAHPSLRAVAGPDDQGASVAQTFGFGTAMVYNTLSEGGMSLKESVVFHCHNASVNQLLMLIAPPTEGGVISNPHDNDPWRPAPVTGIGWNSSVGMIQAAARLSLIARTTCPQATGVVIDDFIQQYIGRNETGDCVNATCPAGQAHPYGDPASGTYCCPDVPTKCTAFACEDCDRPVCGNMSSTGDCVCCLVPGTAVGCQNAPICKGAPPPANICHNRPMITLQNMRDIKAAVQGKTIRADGTVDHGSVALTPHLGLAVCWYDFELGPAHNWLKNDGLLDVIDSVSGPWIWKQTGANTIDYAQLVKGLRAIIPPTMPVLPGIYVRNSEVKFVEPASLSNLLRQTINMYDQGENQPATLLFAGVWLEQDHMSRALWDSYQLPQLLESIYYKFVGSAQLTIVDDHKQPLAGANVTVHYGRLCPSCPVRPPWTFVTRKITAADGRVGFGGWTGNATLTPHTVQVEGAAGACAGAHEVQLKARSVVTLTLTCTAQSQQQQALS